jgi:hypothetical protein
LLRRPRARPRAVSKKGPIMAKAFNKSGGSGGEPGVRQLA